MESLPQPKDPVDMNHLTINVAGTPMSLDSIGIHEVSLEQVCALRSTGWCLVYVDGESNQKCVVVRVDNERPYFRGDYYQRCKSGPNGEHHWQ